MVGSERMAAVDQLHQPPAVDAPVQRVTGDLPTVVYERRRAEADGLDLEWVEADAQERARGAAAATAP